MIYVILFLAVTVAFFAGHYSGSMAATRYFMGYFNTYIVLRKAGKEQEAKEVLENFTEFLKRARSAL